MTIETREFTVQSSGRDEIHNITEQVAHIVRSSSVTSGIVTVFVAHSTAAVTTIEFEPGAVADLSQTLRRLVPEDSGYKHNRIDDNAHSHLRAALIGPSIAIPFARGQVLLGTWQQIAFVDFDNRSRSRRIVVQMVGE